MQEHKLVGYFALALIGSHLISLFYLLILAVVGRFEIVELTTAISVILPLFGMYTAAAIKHLGRLTKARSRSNEISRYVVIAYFSILASFVAYMLAIISWKAFGSLTHEDLLALAGIGETVLGVYVGIIVGSLFKEKSGFDKQ